MERRQRKPTSNDQNHDLYKQPDDLEASKRHLIEVGKALDQRKFKLREFNPRRPVGLVMMTCVFILRVIPSLLCAALIFDFAMAALYPTSHYKPLDLSLEEFEKFDENSDILDVTIVTIATGGYNADEFVEFVSAKGKWPKEKTLVLADDCHAAPDLTKTEMAQVERTSTALEAKFLKTKVFDYVTTQKAVFMDSDVKVLRPVVNYFQEIGEWDETCHAYMQVYPFFPFVRFGSLTERFFRHLVMFLDDGFDFWNSGLFLVDREKSPAFLEAWGKLIKSGKYKKDQWALRDLLENSEFKVCPLPEEMNFEAAFASQINKYFFSYTFSHETSAASERYSLKCGD